MSTFFNGFNRPSHYHLLSIALLTLSACGGGGSSSVNGGSGGGGGSTGPDSAPVPSISIGLKQLQFSWPAVTGSNHYRILSNPDGLSGFSVVSGADNITDTSHDLDISVHRFDWVAAQYMVEACNADESTCLSSTSQTVTPADAIAATGYFKAHNAESTDTFGYSIALSSNGNILAVGAYAEDGSHTSAVVNPVTDNGEVDSGAVYIFGRDSDGVWTQQAYVKATNTNASDWFGYDISLSDNGKVLAVGAPRESSVATGIGGNQADNTTTNAGAVYIYISDGYGTWYFQTYVKASTTDASDLFGSAVTLSGDGQTLAVGAPDESSAATGIDGTQADNSASNAGAVYVYTSVSNLWYHQAYLKASNTDASDAFGTAVALSTDGSTLAVGASGEASSAAGIDGNQSDNTAAGAGAVYVFTRALTTWSQQAYVKASNPQINDWFGSSLALSGDGDTLAVGAFGEASNATGIDGDQSNNDTDEAGAAYVFTRSSNTWSQQAYIKASNTDASDRFASTVALSSDGSLLAVGAYNEDSAASGINGDQSDMATNAGAAYVFTRTAGAWSEQSYVKASNTEGADLFGRAVALSDDGDILAVGAINEDSAATGINGDQADNSASAAGAIYLY